MKKLCVGTLYASALILVTSGARPVVAQEHVPGTVIARVEDLTEISLSDLLNIKVEVSSRHAETIAEAPSSVTAFSREEILRMGATSIEQVLSHVPGFYVSSDTFHGRSARISVRGIRSAFESSVLVLVDGRPVNDLFHGTVAIFNREMAIERVKRIEVIRGPGSALYGANAFAGVVNVVSEDDTTYASGAAGYPNVWRGAASVAGQTGDLSGSFFAQGFSDSGFLFEGVRDASGTAGDVRDPLSGHELAAKLATHGFTLHFRDVQRHNSEFLGSGYASRMNRGEWRQTAAALDWRSGPLADERLELEAGVGYTRETQDMLELVLPKGSEVVPRIITLNEDSYAGYVGDTFGLDGHLDLTARPWEDNEAKVGVQLQRIALQGLEHLQTHDTNMDWTYLGGMRELGAEQNWANPDATRNVIAAYLQDQQRLAERLVLTVGLRLDHHVDLATELTPRAAIVYRTPLDSTIKLMYGRAFRAPNFAEMYQQNNPVIVGYPYLKPELIDTVEGAYTHGFEVFSATATAYWNHADRLIGLGEQRGSGARPYENRASLVTYGYELELQTTPLWGVRMRGAFDQILRATEGKRKAALDQPTLSASGIVDYELGPFNIDLSAIYHNRLEGSTVQGAFVLVNASAQYRASEELVLIATAENIGDQRYLAASDYVATGVPQRGRTLWAGIRFEASRR